MSTAVSASATLDANQIELVGVDRHFEEQLNELHEMIYRRGGIQPVNAAIDELAKLVFLLWMKGARADLAVGEELTMAGALDPTRIEASEDVSEVKEAFRVAIADPEVAGQLPGGGTQPIWPLDEPFRLARPDVLAETVRMLDAALTGARDYDVLGTAFDVFLRGRYDHAGGLGTHLTPHTVVTHLVRMSLAELDLMEAPVFSPVAGDPCCGTGRFLVGLICELKASLASDDPECPEVQRRGRNLRSLIQTGLLGADQSASAVAKARLNLLLFGAQHPLTFRTDDSITSPAIDRVRGQLRLILTNPPFGEGKYEDAQGVGRTVAKLPGLATRKRIDPALAFVVRCLDLLGDDGRLGIILPDGVVDGSALKDALLRNSDTRWRDISVEANVGLPTATFALAGTVARTSAVILRKGGSTRSTVFLARAKHVGYVRQAGVRAADPSGNDLPAICDAYLSTLSERSTGAAAEEGVTFVAKEPLAAMVRVSDLGTLDPARVDPAAITARADLSASDGARFAELLRPVKRRAFVANGDKPFVSVLHVDDLGAVRWHEAETYRPTTPGRTARRGEIIVSMLNPSKLRATVIPDDFAEVLCSSEFAVFEPQVSAWEALVLLYDERVQAQLAPLGRGTSSSRRRIEPTDLLDVLAPRPHSPELAARGDNLRGALASIRAGYAAAAQVHRRSQLGA